MKPLWVNRAGTISHGMLKNVSGLVVAFDSEEDKALIQIDNYTIVQISSDFICQNDDE